MSYEQTEQDFREIERARDLPPDEPDWDEDRPVDWWDEEEADDGVT